MIDALEQKATELLLELLDLKRDRGLRIADLLGRLGEASELCHLDKRNKIS
jgi:hypothetical protein